MSRPNSAFRARGIHALGRDLDGVEAVDADLDEIGDEAADGAARMEEEARSRAALDERHDLGVEWLDDVTVGRRREERRMLGAQVVGLGGDVDEVADLVEDPLPVRQLQLGDALHELPGQLRVGGQVHVAVLVAAEAEVHLRDACAERAHEDGPVLHLADVARPLRHAREAPRVAGVGPGEGRMSEAPMAPCRGALVDS